MTAHEIPEQPAGPTSMQFQEKTAARFGRGTSTCPHATVHAVLALHWWGRGPDGWPLLAVPLGGVRPDGRERDYPTAFRTPPIIHLLEASTGSSFRRWRG